MPLSPTNNKDGFVNNEEIVRTFSAISKSIGSGTILVKGDKSYRVGDLKDY
jgi:hypothetical protein